MKLFSIYIVEKEINGTLTLRKLFFFKNRAKKLFEEESSEMEFWAKYFGNRHISQDDMTIVDGLLFIQYEDYDNDNIEDIHICRIYEEIVEF